MPQLFSCQPLPLAALRPAAWNLHPFLPAERSLFQAPASIARHGLLYVPLAMKADDSTFELLTGYRSMMQYVRCNQQARHIVCRVLDEALTVRDRLSLLYAELADHRQMTCLEQAHMVQLSQQLLPAEEAGQLLADLGIDPHPHTRKRLLDLLRLEPELKLALHDGLLAENMAREMLHLAADDRLTFFTLCKQLGFGGGKQKRAYSLLRDLAGRHAVSFQAVLDDHALSQVLANTEMNIPQKGQLLLTRLQQLHSPAMTEARQAFARWQDSLNLPKNWLVQPSQSFEHDKVQLVMEFESAAGLEEFVEQMADATSRPDDTP